MSRFNVKLSGKLGGALRRAKRLGAAEDLPDDTRIYPTTEGIEEFADSENWMNRPDWQAINMLMQRDEVMSRMYEEGRMRGFARGVVSLVARDLLNKGWLSLNPKESHYSYDPKMFKEQPDQSPSVEEYLSRSRARLSEEEYS